MVAVETLHSEAVRFESQIFDSDSFESEVGNWKIGAEKRSLNSAAENFDMTVVVVGYMNFVSDSAIEGVHNSIEVLWVVEYYRGSGLWKFHGYYLWRKLSFDHDLAKRSPSGAVVFYFSGNR